MHSRHLKFYGGHTPEPPLRVWATHLRSLPPVWSSAVCCFRPHASVSILPILQKDHSLLLSIILSQFSDLSTIPLLSPHRAMALRSHTEGGCPGHGNPQDLKTQCGWWRWRPTGTQTPLRQKEPSISSRHQTRTPATSSAIAYIAQVGGHWSPRCRYQSKTSMRLHISE